MLIAQERFPDSNVTSGLISVLLWIVEMPISFHPWPLLVFWVGLSWDWIINSVCAFLYVCVSWSVHLVLHLDLLVLWRTRKVKLQRCIMDRISLKPSATLLIVKSITVYRIPFTVTDRYAMSHSVKHFVLKDVLTALFTFTFTFIFLADAFLL